MKNDKPYIDSRHQGKKKPKKNKLHNENQKCEENQIGNKKYSLLRSQLNTSGTMNHMVGIYHHPNIENVWKSIPHSGCQWYEVDHLNDMRGN